MELIIVIVMAINLLLLVISSLQAEQIRKRSHEERMELIKLIKAGSLSEFELSGKPLPKTENPIRERARRQFLEGEGDE